MYFLLLFSPLQNLLFQITNSYLLLFIHTKLIIFLQKFISFCIGNPVWTHDLIQIQLNLWKLQYNMTYRYIVYTYLWWEGYGHIRVFITLHKLDKLCLPCFSFPVVFLNHMIINYKCYHKRCGILIICAFKKKKYFSNEAYHPVIQLKQDKQALQQKYLKY